MKGVSRAIVLVTALMTAQAGWAANDKDLVPDKVESKAAKKAGWFPRLTLGASVSFSHSSKVVGAQDGQTWNIGPLLDFGIDYYGGPHEWRTTLGIREVFTRTPVVDEFVKTVDTLKLETIYLFHIPGVDWLGPFAKASLESAMFATTDVRATPAKYVFNGSGAPVVTDAGKLDADGNADRLDLTDAFAPLLLKQSLGLFAQPVSQDSVKLELRLGVGAKEVFVQNGLAINDNGDTPEVEIDQLKDYSQMGGEAFAGISGTLTFEDLGKARPLLYSLTGEALIPFYSSDDDGKSNIELTSITIEAKLGIKLFSWASLDYSLKAVRDPLLLDQFQIQNNLLLNFNYTLIGQ